MKTKILYCLTSTDKDIYLEQMWVSLTSLRMHNPDSYVVVLMDEATKSNIAGYRSKALELVNQVIVVPVPKNFSQHEASRYVKTTARKWIEGDFLFIDTDTIICDDLSGIDDLEGDILMCPEFHGKFAEDPYRDKQIQKMQRIFNVDVSDAPYYFNSGIILCRDTELSHSLYQKWNECWTYSVLEKSFSKDQPALFKAAKEMGYPIGLLAGEYHCQLYVSVKYLSVAKIIHFFNVNWFRESNISPFFGKDIYLQIKQNQNIDADTLSLISNVKSLFPNFSAVFGKDDVEFISTYKKAITDIIKNNDTLIKKLSSLLIRFSLSLYYRSR